ncbi:MAG TPA: Uma2 family endonuclease [Chthonomonadaceae bacterium]|nr:Uma2 family endonuclease [Chthonomonadaceae bacterium]
MSATIPLKQVKECSTKWVGPRPITFEEFLDLFGPVFDKEYDVELIDGTVVERMSAQLEHEKLFNWLYRLMGDYVEERNLGIVLGSRTPVKINDYRGRLPDLLFVRQERLDIVEQRAIYGAPDLAVEIVSPSDRPSNITALETDYRSLGVSEIWLIDLPRRRVRVLRRRDGDYTEEERTTGLLSSEAIEGFRLEIEWLWTEPRPAVRATLAQLLEEPR